MGILSRTAGTAELVIGAAGVGDSMATLFGPDFLAAKGSEGQVSALVAKVAEVYQSVGIPPIITIVALGLGFYTLGWFGARRAFSRIVNRERTSITKPLSSS